MTKILITGGTGSVGKALVNAFANHKKYKIEFTYYNNNKLAEKLAKKLNTKAFKLTKRSKSFYEYDIIINNAAIINSFTETESVDLKDWNEAIDVNLTLPFQIIKKSLPYMKSKKWGRIINISSIYGFKAEADILTYNVTKHGLIGLTRTVAKEYAEFGITCNAICPGTINSELANRVADIYTKNKSEKNNYFKEIIENIPAKRLAEPEEIAKLALFLASEDAAYINGATLVIDGGLTC